MQHEIILEGEPFGKERPRKARGLRGLYTPTKTKQYEAMVRSKVAQFADMTEQPIGVTIIAAKSVPKSYSKKRREKCLNLEELPTKKPDIDNIEKIILDGLNPLRKLNKATHKREVIMRGYYSDDAQVVYVNKIKIYAERPYVKVILEDFNQDKAKEFLQAVDGRK